MPMTVDLPLMPTELLLFTRLFPWFSLRVHSRRLSHLLLTAVAISVVDTLRPVSGHPKPREPVRRIRPAAKYGFDGSSSAGFTSGSIRPWFRQSARSTHTRRTLLRSRHVKDAGLGVVVEKLLEAGLSEAHTKPQVLTRLRLWITFDLATDCVYREHSTRGVL